jgi:large subunit ribosomal protein L25
MDRVKLVVQHRSETGTRNAKRLRAAGLIPGVLYGAGKPALPLVVESRELRSAVTTDAGTHAVIDVLFEGTKTAHVAIVKDMQLDAVRHVVTHVDLQEIKLTDKIETTVVVHFEGTPHGVKMGGMLDINTHEVTVVGLPTDIPEHLDVDVEALEMGDVAHVSDLIVPENIQVLDDPDEVVCSVLAPKIVEEEVEEVEGEAAATEPEVVGKPEAEEGAE